MKKRISIFISVLLIIFNGCDNENINTENSDIDYLVTTGYYLFSPMLNSNVYLIDEDGDVEHQWETNYNPGLSVYLLEDGTLLRAESVTSVDFDAGGSGGRIAMYDSSSNETWSYTYADSNKLLHHDVEMLPNGNILMIAWEKYTKSEAIEQGLDVSLFTEDEIWADHIIEVDPTTDQIVWEWHVWDHLIQDYDSSKTNYGDINNNPGKIDLNYFGSNDLKDWNHINSVDYNEELDQILLSLHSFSEIWIIDHNITTDEAKTESGDLIYRWGNPEAVNEVGDRNLYYQHDAEWLDSGNILIFNNGDRRERPYSSVVEITYDSSSILNPPQIIWEYESGEEFYATNISGSQRLDNGNTLICDGPSGQFFEVTPEKEIIWEYTNPYTSSNGIMNSVFRVDRYDSDYSGITCL